jgi:gluconolactonase
VIQGLVGKREGENQMKKHLATFSCLLLLLTSASTLLLAVPEDSQIERLDPSLDSIIHSDAKLEKVAGGFQFTEGPVWDKAGNLFFVDINAAVINKLTPDGKVVRFYGPDQLTERDLSVAGVPGANGLTVDHQGRLTMCDQGHRVVSRLGSNGKITVMADRYQGKRFNSPNDLVYKSDGSLYFTDPPYGLEKEDQDKNRELSINGVYRVSHGKILLLIKDLPRPNGIAFTPDEKSIYIDNSEPQKIIMRYGVNPDGTLGNGTLFADLSAGKEPGVPDGLKVDQLGNVYSTGPGGIWIFSSQGKHLGTIHVPEVAANCAWGGKNGRFLYITATTSVYRIKLQITGVRPVPTKN